MSDYDAVDGARSAASKCYRLVASKSERFKEVRLGNDAVLKFWRNWRGHDDVMQTRSIRGSGEPAWVSASLNACLRLGPDPRRALWPAATPAAQTGRTHDRTRPMLQQRQKVLAKAAPSTMTQSGPSGLRLDTQFIWSISAGDFSCDEELSFCGMLHNGNHHSPKNSPLTASHNRR